MVLGTINGILSPVCSATSSLVEQQTLRHEEYQEEKDELEREAMLRDPAKAFLVSDEEFDKKMDELGWSLGDMDTMINMYGQKAVYDMGGKGAAMVPRTVGTVLSGGLAADRHTEDFLPDCPFHTGANLLCAGRL